MIRRQISRQSAHEGGQSYALAAFTMQAILLVLISVAGCVNSRTTERTEGISMRNSSNTIANRTRDLLACCEMLQPNAAPRFYQGNS